jgi:hypothetical protein
VTGKTAVDLPRTNTDLFYTLQCKEIVLTPQSGALLEKLYSLSQVIACISWNLKAESNPALKAIPRRVNSLHTRIYYDFKIHFNNVSLHALSYEYI